MIAAQLFYSSLQLICITLIYVSFETRWPHKHAHTFIVLIALKSHCAQSVMSGCSGAHSGIVMLIYIIATEYEKILFLKKSNFEQILCYNLYLKPGEYVKHSTLTFENKTGSVSCFGNKHIHDSMEMYDIIPCSSRSTETVSIPLARGIVDIVEWLIRFRSFQIIKCKTKCVILQIFSSFQRKRLEILFFHF